MHPDYSIHSAGEFCGCLNRQSLLIQAAQAFASKPGRLLHDRIAE
jgi:hypothetical protein